MCASRRLRAPSFHETSVLIALADGRCPCKALTAQPYRSETTLEASPSWIPPAHQSVNSVFLFQVCHCLPLRVTRHVLTRAFIAGMRTGCSASCMWCHHARASSSLAGRDCLRLQVRDANRVQILTMPAYATVCVYCSMGGFDVCACRCIFKLQGLRHYPRMTQTSVP